MQLLRHRPEIRDLVLILALTIGIPSFNLVSAQDPTLQVTKPKSSQSAGIRAGSCGGQSGDNASSTEPLPGQIGFLISE